MGIDGTVASTGSDRVDRVPCSESGAATDPFHSVRHWLYDVAMPYWLRHGLDTANGGFVEHFRLDGSNPNADFKRTRVIARQIYAFSHADMLGMAGSLSHAQHGFTFLAENGWQGPEKGWARRLTIDGRVLDGTPDLYDLAFVLFSLGWFSRAGGGEGARAWGIATADFIDARMRHPSGLGYAISVPAAGNRRQNPHMHLLEAALSAYEAWGDPRFARLADELVELFCCHMFDHATGTVPEYFDEEMQPAAGEAGSIVEPGHQFEWAWLLAHYQRISGRDMRTFVRALVGFSERYGVDPRTGAVFDVVRNDGLAIGCGERTWPAAERLQAAVAMFELDGQNPMPVFRQTVERLMTMHLAHKPAGTWLDHFTAEGRPRSDKIPSSTLYHLVVAFTEMLRIEDAVRSAVG